MALDRKKYILIQDADGEYISRIVHPDTVANDLGNPAAVDNTTVPLADSGAGSAGDSTKASPANHRHPLGGGLVLDTATAPATDFQFGSAGVSTKASPADHSHPLDPTNFGVASVVGSSTIGNVACQGTVFGDQVTGAYDLSSQSIVTDKFSQTIVTAANTVQQISATGAGHGIIIFFIRRHL